MKQPLEKEGSEFEIFDGCKPDAPLSVIRNCAQLAKDGHYDLIIGLGGGSAMDTVKMASLVAITTDVAREELHDYFEEVEGRRGLPTLSVAGAGYGQ